MTRVHALSGVNRFVIIGGQIHSYVDILLDTTELCGDNGKGKTSTMNVLQFLYIANERQWSLGKHTLNASKDFYFPPSNVAFAATVFEVRTPAGTRLVIVRRPNGLLSELRYYVAIGGYDRNDFVNERHQPRKWDEVKLRLGERGKIWDITDQHQLCLTGRADEASGLPNLALVPLSTNEGSTYEKFASSFVNLLRLKDMDQQYLQEILVSYAGLTKNQQMVDLEASLTTEINSIRAGVMKAERLGSFSASINQAWDEYEEVLSTGTWLNQVHPRILTLRREYEAEYPLRLKEAKAAVSAADTEAVEIANERRRLADQRKVHVIAESDCVRKLEALACAESAFADYDRGSAVATRDAKAAEARAIRGRIAKATDKSLLELETDVAERRDRVRRLEGDINAYSELLVSWMRGKLPNADVVKLHALFSPDVFRVRMGAGGAEVIADAAFEGELRTVLARIDGAKLVTDGVKLPLDTKKAAEHVRELADVKLLRDRLADENVRLEKARKLLADAKVQAELEMQASGLEANVEALSRRLLEFDRFRESLPLRPSWEKERDEARLQMERLDQAASALDERLAKTGLRKQSANEALQRLEAEKRTITDMTMDGSLKAFDAVEDVPRQLRPVEETTLFPLMQAYKKRSVEFTRARNEWERSRATLESNLSDLYPGITAPRAILKHLKGEVDALPQRREFENGRLRTALASATGLFQELVSGLARLEREVRKIQRAFSKVKISYRVGALRGRAQEG